MRDILRLILKKRAAAETGTAPDGRLYSVKCRTKQPLKTQFRDLIFS